LVREVERTGEYADQGPAENGKNRKLHDPSVSLLFEVIPELVSPFSFTLSSRGRQLPDSR